MLKSPLFRFLIWKFKLDLTKPSQSNAKYVDELLSELRSSRHVGRAILLGMDGVYNQQGKLDEKGTEFLISNQCCPIKSRIGSIAYRARRLGIRR